MRTFFASARSCAAVPASDTTHSPRSTSHSMFGSTSTVFVLFSVPLIPSNTPTMERFIATHMICDKIAPDAPMSAPTTSAHPEDEFKTVITTGVSPPPTASVACRPMNAPRAAIAPRALTASPVAPATAALKNIAQ
eukprot:30937-Pelagococcus_subviridis.AAC.32